MLEFRQQAPIANQTTNWNTILAFAAVAVSTQLLWVTFTPITTESARLLGVSEGAVGWLSEVFPLVYVVLAIPFGLITDRWFRPSLVLGTLLTFIGAALRIQGHFTFILIGQLVTSVGQPLILNAINKTAVVYAAPNKQTVAISVSSASLFLGILLAMLSGPIILGQFGMSGLLYAQAAFAVATGIWLLSALFASRRFVHVDNPLHLPVQHSRNQQTSLRQVWARREIRQLCFLLFIGFGLFIALTTWLQVLLAPKRIDAVEVGIALALMTAAGMIGAAIVPDWAIRRKKAKMMILASLIASIAASLYILIGLPFWLMTSLLVIAGFLLLADLPVVLTISELIAEPEQAGTVNALLMLFGNAGGIVLALLVQGLIASTTAAVAVLLVGALAAIPFASRFPAYTDRSSTS